MKTALTYKVYAGQKDSPARTYVSACADAGAAITLADYYGEGSQVRDGHSAGRDARHVVYSAGEKPCADAAKVLQAYEDRKAKWAELDKQREALRV